MSNTKWKRFSSNSLDEIYNKEEWKEHKNRMFKMTQIVNRMDTRKPHKNKKGNTEQ